MNHLLTVFHNRTLAGIFSSKSTWMGFLPNHRSCAATYWEPVRSCTPGPRLAVMHRLLFAQKARSRALFRFLLSHRVIAQGARSVNYVTRAGLRLATSPSCTGSAATLNTNWITPVTLPPGRLRLATRASRTGSSATAKTIGIVVVPALAASAVCVVPGGGNYGHASTDKVGDELRQTIVAALQPMVIDRDVLPLDIAGFPEAVAERGCGRRECLCRPGLEEPDHP